MLRGFALDFRGDRRSADRALWKHLHDVTSAEVGGETISDLRVAWMVRWTERDPVTHHFVDTGAYAICATEWNAFTLARSLRADHASAPWLDFDVRKLTFPAGKLSKSDRFRGYRQVLGRKVRGKLLTRHERDAIKEQSPRSRFVKCYVPMPEGVAPGKR